MHFEQPLYLSSLESYRFEPVRECRLVRMIQFDTGKQCALVTLHPGVPGQEFDVSGDLDLFVIATRFEGTTLSPIVEFPCFVFIGLPSENWETSNEVISANEVQVIGWGELYRSAEEAEAHSFG